MKISGGELVGIWPRDYSPKTLLSFPSGKGGWDRVEEEEMKHLPVGVSSP